MLAGVQMNHGSSSAHVQWFPTKMVEQMFVTSLNDVTSISHALEGGNYKREMQLSSRSLDATITVI